jgi:hypothetical protein
VLLGPRFTRRVGSPSELARVGNSSAALPRITDFDARQGGIPFTRSSIAWDVTDAGAFTEVAVNARRGNANGRLLEGTYTNLVSNPRFVGTTTFHTGTPARVKPVVVGGVVTSFTILEGGSGYTVAPIIFVTSAVDATCNLTGGVVTSVTVSDGGTGISATQGCVTISGHLPSGWVARVSTQNYASLAVTGAQTIDGIPCMLVRFVSERLYVYLRCTLNSTSVSPGEVLSQSAHMAWLGGDIETLVYVGQTFNQVSEGRRFCNRKDWFQEFPGELLFIENPGHSVADGVTTLSSVQWLVAGGTPEVPSDITLAIGAPFLGRGPTTTTPIMPAAGLTGFSSRAADLSVIQSNVFSSLFSASSWGIAVDAVARCEAATVGRVLWQIDDGTDSNRVSIINPANTAGIAAEVAISGVVTATTDFAGAYMPGTRFRVVLTGGFDTLDITMDGGETKSVSTAIPIVTTAREGNNVTISRPFDGWIYRALLLPHRPTDNQKTFWSDPANTVGSLVLGTPTIDRPFSVVTFPDTHVVDSSVEEWERIWNWCINNKVAYNIAAAIGEGDVITDGTNEEFDLAQPGWDAFDDALLPNISAIGNHDYDTSARVPDRLSTAFDGHFTVARMSDKPWYGGVMSDTTKNSWIKFEVGGRKFLVLNLEIWPDDDMLAWGLSVCNANLDREVLFVTHSHQDPDGTLTAQTDENGSGTTRTYPRNDAFAVWDKLGKVAPNMKFIVSGHQYRSYYVPKTSYLPDTGDSGNRVHQWFCNYQTVNFGNGMLGLLRFHTARDTVDLCAYSTLTGTPDLASVLLLDW